MISNFVSFEAEMATTVFLSLEEALASNLISSRCLGTQSDQTRQDSKRLTVYYRRQYRKTDAAPLSLPRYL